MKKGRFVDIEEVLAAEVRTSVEVVVVVDMK